MKSTLFMKLMGLICILSFVLVSCSTPTTPPPAATDTAAPANTVAPAATDTAAPAPTNTTAPQPTATTAAAAAQPTNTAAAALPTNTVAAATQAPGAPVPANAAEYLKAARADQLIVDNPYKLTYPDNWNPYTLNNSYGWGMSEVGSGDPQYLNYGDGKYIPWNATSIDSNADGTVWTMKLRPGITWSDGQPFTADDVVFSINLQVKNEKLGSHFYLVEWLDTIKKLDDLTVQLNLKKPNVRFALENFSSRIGGNSQAGIFVPKHIWETVADPTTFKNYDLAKGLPLGTGPYVLAKVTTNETLFVRNDNWWGAKTGFKPLPQPKEIIFSYVGTEEVRTQTAIQNNFDSMQDITLGAYQAIIAQNKKWAAFYPDKPYSWLDPCARIISFNSLKAPWDDKQMRQMINYVMNRQQIIDIAYEGTTMMGPYYWPHYPAMKPFEDLIPADTMAKFLKPDTAAAAKILTDKGYVKGTKYYAKGGKDLTIEIQVPSDFIELTRVGDVLVEQLQKFGVNASESKLAAAFYTNSNVGAYESQSNWFACGSVNEPFSTLNTFTGQAAPLGTNPKGPPIDNAFRWYNKAYDDLVAQIGTLKLDDPKVLDLTKQALTILYDELPALPSAQARKLVPFNNTYWTGWPTAANYYITPTDWWDNFIVTVTTIKKAQ
jgi:peptide/nickel transport system substrate-binding protein